MAAAGPELNFENCKYTTEIIVKLRNYKTKAQQDGIVLGSDFFWYIVSILICNTVSSKSSKAILRPEEERLCKTLKSGDITTTTKLKKKDKYLS